MAVISFFMEKGSKEAVLTLVRPPYGESYKEYELEVMYGDTKESVSLKVNEQKLTFEEAEKLLAKCYDEIMLMVREKNGNLNEISGDIKLPESVLDGNAEVGWYSTNTEYVENNGELTAKAYKELPDEGLVVTMYAKVDVSEDYSARFEVPVHLSASGIKASRSVRDIINDILISAEKDQSEGNEVVLPAEIEGNTVAFYEKQKSEWWKYPLFVIIVLFMYAFMKTRKAETIAKNRNHELELSYAPIVTKLTLLIGAGSSIRGAWERLSEEYKSAGYSNAAYDELLKVNNEMRNGMSEQQAYGIFGKRCRLSMYVRLGNLLEQNLRKGTKGLSERLEEEVREAFENRKALAIRLGEEAGTKLLFPMLLLLVIIIVICVVPAFLCM